MANVQVLKFVFFSFKQIFDWQEQNGIGIGKKRFEINFSNGGMSTSITR